MSRSDTILMLSRHQAYLAEQLAQVHGAIGRQYAELASAERALAEHPVGQRHRKKQLQHLRRQLQDGLSICESEQAALLNNLRACGPQLATWQYAETGHQSYQAAPQQVWQTPVYWPGEAGNDGINQYASYIPTNEYTYWDLSGIRESQSIAMPNYEIADPQSTTLDIAEPALYAPPSHPNLRYHAQTYIAGQEYLPTYSTNMVPHMATPSRTLSVSAGAYPAVVSSQTFSDTQAVPAPVANHPKMKNLVIRSHTLDFNPGAHGQLGPEAQVSSRTVTFTEFVPASSKLQEQAVTASPDTYAGVHCGL
ncbi:hypothetical protein B0A49_06179 [Cryomyces minteri]|uniref:Uncharacterized protein n=1 Tax=Cryomyces minteri TaxID=331657 RepID=A0A4U0WWC9_9PEZI|nr:hypothetical protein B0A49_06179 [Cryomyces minteri]